MNPSTLSSMLVSSISSQVNSFLTSEQVAAAGTAGAGVGAGVGLTAFGVGAIPGAVTGLMTGSMTAMETGLTFAELLQEEVGGDLTAENVRAVLNDEEKLSELRRKAGGRGLAIGAVEAATMGLAKGVGGKIASKGFKFAPAVAAGTAGAIEVAGGGLGEVAGRVAADQEMDIAEIGFEAFAGLGSAPVSMANQVLNINTNIDRVKINNQLKNTEYNNLVEAFDPSTEVTEANLNISQIKNSTKILDEQVDAQVKAAKLTPEQGEAIKKNFRSTQSATNKAKRVNLKQESEVEVVSLLKEKEVLDGEIKSVNEKSLTLDQQNRVKEIDTRLSEIVGKDREVQVEESVKFAKSEGKKFGLKTEAISSKKEFGDRFGEEAAESDGFIQGDTIYINKEVAKETGAVSVGSHELLHGILNKALKGKDSAKLVQDFRNQLNSEQLSVLDSKLKAVDEKGNRLYSDDYLTKNPDEALTLFSDAIAKKEIAYDENIFTKLKDFFTPILRKAGFSKIKFDTGRDVYNFLREYNKSIKEGKLSEAISELGVEEAEVSDRKLSRTQKVKVPGVEDAQVQTMIDKVANRAAAKFFSGIPQNIREEAGLTRRSYIDSAKSELAGIAEKFDPEKAEFDRYMANTGMQRLNSLASRLGVKSAEDQTTRITEDTKQIAAEEETSRDVRTEREIRQDERKGIKVREKLPKVYDVDKVVKSIRAKAKSLKAKNIKQLKGTALEEVSMMIGRDEELGKSIFKKISKNADLNKPEMLAIQKFINSNIDIAKGSLLEGYTSEFKATGVVNKLLEKFYNKRSIRAKTGPGLKVQIKKPNISDVEFKEAFGITGKDQDNWNQKVVAKKGGVSDILKGFVRNFDQVISSQEIREQLIQDGESIEALRTLRDGIPPQLFSKSTKEKQYFAENLGKTFSKLNEDQKETYLANIPQFIELITAGYSVDAAFMTSFGDFLTKKDKQEKQIPNATRISIVNDWKTIIDQFPKTLYRSKKFNKTKLNEYLHTAFAEQTSRELVRDILGINKDGLDWRSPSQITSYVSFIKEYFGDLRQNFNSDLEFFEYVITHFEKTFTGAAKIGGLPNHIWTEDGKLVEGKKTKRSASIRAGIFNNRTEFYNVLLKSFDVENKLKPARGGFTYDGNLIEINRAPQSDTATKKYLNEFLNTGKLSSATLKLSYDDAIGNQNAIIRLLNWYKTKENTDADININDLGMFFVNSTGDMTAILRSAYFMDSIALGDSKNPKDYRFEHNPPVRVMQIYMAQFVNGTISESQLKEKFADTSVSVIPKLMDDAINIRYKDTIPMNSTNRFDRYYNPTTYGKFPFEMTVYTPQLDKDGNITSFKKSVKGKDLKQAYQDEQAAIKANKQEASDSQVISDKDMTNDDMLKQFSKTDKALDLANSLNQPIKKIRVFDFDDTLAYTKTGKLNAEEFAKQGKELLDQGYKFDFSEFNKVTKGKPGPLLEIAKKIKAARGNEDLFVLTARAPKAQQAIYEFLKSQSVEFKKQNIVGLGNSTGEAKAQWLVGKAAEGYNDFYFAVADDAVANVSAVKKAMSVLDVKSKIQQARPKFSKSLSEDFNKIIEETKGIGAEKTYSEARAKQIGASKGKGKFWIPYSAEDMLGLIYPLIGKGKVGDAQMKFFKENLFNPFSKAMDSLAAARVQLMADFEALKKNLDVPKDLQKEAFDNFTNEQVVRMYIWDSQGMEVPGLSKRDLADVKKVIEGNEKLKTFAEELIKINKEDGYPAPADSWLAGTITTDLIEGLNTVKRPKYLQQWQENVDAIFSKENLNKLEAAYGSKYREALQNMLTRMKTGKNRIEGSNRLSDRLLDWINGSVGAIMFFNTRSAVLQLISSINFINWNDNNIYAAGKAFANQKQYWSDFKKLMNSDFLVDRRNGLKINISESEIADAAKTSKNKARAVLNYILKKGFLPTQIADSFAIASGGATFYRNRINTYISEGMTQAEAEAQAFQDFRELAEESQQSSRPDKISQQQASSLGRLLLAFANTPMQYGRLTKRAYQDLVAGRGDRKSNISKIIYYTAVQNLIFNALQAGIQMLGFGDDEEKDEDKEKTYTRVANGMADSLLRGLGIGGAAVSVGKNFLMDLYERSGRSRPEYVDSIYKLLQFSPPISSKISKLRQAAWMFDSKERRKEIYEKGFALDNPAYEAAGKVISATTNLPVDRVYNKVNNIDAALAEDTETWETIAMLLGWPEWQIKPPKKKKTKKKKRKKGGYKSSSKERERGRSRNY
jgi:hypothetical protein